MKLTRRQKEILEFIKYFIKTQQYSPSVREIAAHFSLNSAGGVHKHIKNLEAKGMLAIEKNISRTLRVLETETGMDKTNRLNNNLLELPLKGKVAAGRPIQHFLENEFISIPPSLVKNPDLSYVLQVQGDSMIEEYICDGDYVIIEKRETANNGEMVIAMINYCEATLKKFYFEGDKIRLQPANYTMEPIIVNAGDVSIQGVVIGVMRRY